MSTLNESAVELLLEAGLDPSGVSPEAATSDIVAMMARVRSDPRTMVIELLRIKGQLDRYKKNCAKAVEAAEKADQLLKQLINGNTLQCRLEVLRQTGEGVRAVCRLAGQIRELSVHPDVDCSELERLEPWEYVCVRENVVVGVWRNDQYLFESALGDVVAFQGYADDSQRLARVSRLGQSEEVVKLAGSLCGHELTSGAKLVLMRDNPQWAIACLPSQQAVSRFEVPISSINTRLSDLAGIEPIAEKLILEIAKRIVSPEICKEYNLDPLRGVLLSSYKPGMGKTAFMRAFALWLSELGQQRGFDVVLYHVKPNELKSMWHGEDARIVREDLFGAIRARQTVKRDRPLVQLLVMDEIDSLGRRPEGRDVVVSSAQADALESLLVELDGMIQEQASDPPAHVLVVGLTNRPDRIDDAIKRPGRMGDEVMEMPELDAAGAEQVCAIYLRSPEIPWSIDGKIRKGLDENEVAQRFLRPALAATFPAVVLQYSTDTQRKIDVTTGEILAGAHYRKAMSVAKDRAAERRLRGIGNPGVGYEDVVEGLLEMSLSVAAQMEADPQMLIRHLKVKTPVARIDITPREELENHRYVRG